MTEAARGGGPILPGATLGVLGGGQLGRMFAIAAAQLGYRVAVFTPEGDSPAGQVADHETVAAYDDLDAIRDFARRVQVVTFEFENVPAATVAALSEIVPVRPSARLLHATQHRIREKTALAELGLPVARFAAIETAADLDAALAHVGAPGVLKTAAWGYDGKGQRRVAAAADLATAWADLDSQPAVYEALVPFTAEVSVVGARGLDGSCALYPPVHNVHTDHILDVSVCPAPFDTAVLDNARAMARTVLEGFDVVGVLCVELFVLEDGGLVVNEVAPRPHNSGHLTIEAFPASQFEQQARAITGLPLGSVEPRAPFAAMANLLGDLWPGGGTHPGQPDWPAALQAQDTHLHLYGKATPRPGRKMGHLTATGPDAATAADRVRAARSQLG